MTSNQTFDSVYSFDNKPGTHYYYLNVLSNKFTNLKDALTDPTWYRNFTVFFTGHGINDVNDLLSGMYAVFYLFNKTNFQGKLNIVALKSNFTSSSSVQPTLANFFAQLSSIDFSEYNYSSGFLLFHFNDTEKQGGDIYDSFDLLH